MGKNLKVLMISSDRNVLVPESAVSERMKEYGALVEELHIVLLSDARHGLKDKQLSKTVWVYPTNSTVNFLRPIDATRIGKKIVVDHKFVRGKSVITTQDPFECGWVGMRIKKKWRIPLEVQLHTDPFSPNFSGLLNVVRKLIAKNIFKFADSIRVVRPKLGRKITENYGIESKMISVLPIYIDTKRFIGDPKFNLHERFKKFKYVVLTISRLSKEKNLHTIITSMLQVDDTVLIIVGSGPEEKSLRKLTQELKISGRVVFEGWQEDLLSYYKTADVLVQASSFEGYGMSIVEAAMCGLPVISTPTGISEDLDEVNKADDVDSFAQRINYLLHNESERKELGKKLMETIKIDTKEEFLTKLKENWEKTANL
ncbi:MAG: glycosyltransferase [bacterium]|nr:glycosyltransferase [bacterium]